MTEWEEQLADAADAAPMHTRWMHMRTKNVYEIVGYAMIESTWKAGIIYASPLGMVVIRDADEFLDGRFKRVSN